MMVGANVKAETVSLMDKRQGIEAEMDSIISRLTRPGGPGLQGNLVDNEGFPMPNLDIPAIRADRQRLSVLRNDYKEITDAIEKNLITLHSGGFTRESSQPDKRTDDQGVRPSQRPTPMDIPSDTESTIAEGPFPMDEDAGESSLPFAVFDEVTDGSPAAIDGVVIGDQLLRFGSVDGGEDLLLRLAREGQANEGRGLPVVVLRRGERLHLTITPRGGQAVVCLDVTSSLRDDIRCFLLKTNHFRLLESSCNRLYLHLQELRSLVSNGDDIRN